jgi:hypothetical protein
MSEFVRLTSPEQVYGETNLLQSQLNLLTIVKQYREYETLRKDELLMKIEAKKLVSEIRESLDVLHKCLPESKLEEEQEKEAKLIKEIVAEVQKEVKAETQKEKRAEALRKAKLLRDLAQKREEERKAMESEKRAQEKKLREQIKKEEVAKNPPAALTPKNLTLDQELAAIKKKLAKL